MKIKRYRWLFDCWFVFLGYILVLTELFFGNMFFCCVEDMMTPCHHIFEKRTPAPEISGAGVFASCLLDVRSLGADKRRFRNASHFGDLLIRMVFQQLQRVVDLLLGVERLSPFPVAGVPAGDFIALLGTLHNHIALKLRKAQHDIANQHPGGGIVQNAHI